MSDENVKKAANVFMADNAELLNRLGSMGETEDADTTHTCDLGDWKHAFAMRHDLTREALEELSDKLDTLCEIPELPDFDDGRHVPHERFFVHAERFMKELAGRDDDVIVDALARMFEAFSQEDRPDGPSAITFEEAWAEKVEQGYQYGEDALQGVRFGWDIHEDVKRRRDMAAEMAIAIMFAEWVSKMAVRMFWKTELCANGIHSGDRGGCEYCGKDE